MFGELMHDVNERLKIRHIEMQGEACRSTTIAALKKLFPLARHYSGYAMGEAGREIGVRGPDCPDQRGGYYHATPNDLFLEEQNGELLITHQRSASRP